jgi:hypothetical protein
MNSTPVPSSVTVPILKASLYFIKKFNGAGNITIQDVTIKYLPSICPKLLSTLHNLLCLRAAGHR